MCAKSRGPVIRSVKAPEALAALRAWLDQMEPGARERGAKYFVDGRVLDVWAEADHYVSAEVEGSEIYDVTLFLTRQKWSSSCTCAVEVGCKHAYATGRAWIAEVESGAAAAAEITPAPLPDYPAAWQTRTPAPQPAKARPSKISFRQQWTPILAEKLGRPLSDAEGQQLGQLSAVFAEFQQGFGLLYPSMLRSHGFGDLIPRQHLQYEPLYQGWWDRTKPPQDPWALWQYIAYDVQRVGRPIPEVFRPMTNTEPVARAMEAMLTARDVAVWRQALTAQEEARVRPSAAAVANVRGRITDNGEFFIETRAAPDKPWKIPAQEWFRNLGSVYPADLDHLPPAEAALAVALSIEGRSNYYQFAAKRPIPSEVVARVLRGAACGAVVLPGEKPFAIEPEPLVREAVPSELREQLALMLVTPDGRPADTARLLSAQPEPLYVFEQKVWRGPAPVPSPRLPVAALNDPQLVTRLRDIGLRLPKSVEAKFQRVTLRARVECWTDVPGGPFGAELFRANLIARSENPPCEQKWIGRGGWQWSDGAAPPARRPDDPILEFDLSAGNAVGSRFGEFRLYWDDWNGAWSRPITKSFPEEFAAWHASLLPGVEFAVSPELAGLLDAPVRGKLDFSAVPTGPGHDWFDLTVGLKVEDTKLSPDEIALLLKARGKWVRLPKLGWRRLEITAETGDASAALERLGLGAADVFATGKPTTHRMHALQLASEAASFEARDAKLAETLRSSAARLAAVPRPPIPAGLRATLRPYQEEGFHFLAHLTANGFGGILADDMGLGKTVQTLAWLLHLAVGGALRPDAADAKAANRSGRRAPPTVRFRALVVCPKSVTHGWLAETERFAPELKAEAFTSALTGKKVSELTSQLVVANYTQLRLNAAWFKDAAWDAVVLDEGQFIKNPLSQAAAVARALPTRNRVVLTGTPVENRLTDLWSLFAFAQPGLLGPQTAFKRQYPENESDALVRLRRRVGHFLLRRTKAQAAPDLPPRTEDDLVVDLEGDQRKLYDAELKRARAQLLGVDTDRAFDKMRFNILASLLRLRQICCHPALIDPAHANLPSAKLEALLERVEELRDEGHQVLVFSQFVEMLELIRTRLAAEGIGHLILTGATENRAQLVQEFQSDRSKTVFLLSLKAAGFGLNLTAASYAILYDPWWNPAVEAQAIDRTHRIGQTRPVMAYRLLADNTIEQKIRALQQEKSALASAVVQEESLASVMDLESLRRILA